MEKYQDLLKLARESIQTGLTGRELNVDDKLKKKYSDKLACFVTLTINGNLRGCIGSLLARQELWKDVVGNARSAALRDNRFEPLREQELKKVKMEISVLSVPKKVTYKDSQDLKKKIIGRGVIITKGYNSATYLPQVWEDLPLFEEFISSLCRKAGLSADYWNSGDLDVETYTVDSVKDK